MSDAPPRVHDTLLALVAALAALAALHVARPAVLPFVTGLMIAALAWPLFRWLQQRRSRAIALLLTIVAVSTVLLAILGAIGWSTASIAADLRNRPERIESLQQRAGATAQRFGIDLSRIGSSIGEKDSPGASDEGSSIGRRIGVGLYSTVGYLALAVGFAALTLAELRDVQYRIRLRFETAQADRILAISSEVAASIRHYFRAKSITSGIAGVATGLLSLLFGIKFAGVWALLAFLFEYVPTIGSILAVAPPVAYAFIQFDDVTKPLVALGAFTTVQLFLGNYVDPRLEGRLLSISPTVVLLAIVFGAWLWGAPGSLLGIPVVVAATVVTRHFASTRWIWALLTEPDEKERKHSRGRDAPASGDTA